jgi:ACS family glucarate transporter-like MFS transporter
MSSKTLFPVRFKMIIATFTLAMIVLFDRILLSVAKDPVAESLQLSDKQMGWAMSIFALGYALFQTPAGLMADKYGPRKILTVLVGLWSLFTALTGAVFNYGTLLAIRFLFGVGEAGAFPGMARAIYSWIPLQERGIVNGINFSGGRIGVAFALPLVAWLIDVVGWRMAFVILGAVGVLWGVAWYWWFRDNPEDHKGMSETEVEYIKNNTNGSLKGEEEGKLDFGKLFKSKQMWLLMGQYFASNFTFFFCLTWLFPHLQAKYNLEAIEAGFYASAPLIFGAFGNWFSGFLIDFIYKKKKLELSRRAPAIIGFVLASVGILASIYMEEINMAIICISIGVFGADMTLSPSWTTCLDVGKHFSGAVSGTMNMAGNIGSFLTALAFPYLLDFTGSEVPFFYLAAGLNGIAIFLWTGIKPQQALQITQLSRYDNKRRF